MVRIVIDLPCIDIQILGSNICQASRSNQHRNRPIRHRNQHLVSSRNYRSVLSSCDLDLCVETLSIKPCLPFHELGFGLNLFAAWLIFDEMISLNHVVGIGIIILGVTILRHPGKVN